MEGSPSGFWGKLDRDSTGNVVAWHPLVDHCADVAAVLEAVLGVTTIRLRLARLAGLDELDDVTRARLCFLAAVHDLGKANLGFQAKGRPELGAPAGHVSEAVALLLHGPDRFAEALQLARLDEWGPGAGGLLMASICHHGRPAGESASFQESWWRPRCGLDPRAELETLSRRAGEWFPAAFSDGPELPNVRAFEHAFAGLVMLADWLGSDRRGSLFPYSGDRAGDRICFARERAARALMAIGLDTSPARPLVVGRDPFGLVAPGLSPRPGQQALLDLPLPDGPSVTVIEAETGSGKTEAALAWFVRLFAAGLVDGMVFALPTRSAATQLHGRVVDAVRSAIPDDNARPPVILAVPGYLRVDDTDGRHLPGFEVLWPDSSSERDRHRGWAAETPKRFMAGPVVVGTIDQVLLSGLMVPHAHLRAATLLRHLLVVDEVHASDDYMTRVLGSVLLKHRRAGGHALMLSATLGGEARAGLVGGSRPTLAAALATPYPLVTIADGAGVSIRSIEHGARNRHVHLEIQPLIDDPTAIALIALGAARRGGKVVVLRNTVAACLATQSELELAAATEDLLFRCMGVVTPHHSRYAREDRHALDRALEGRLGKSRDDRACVVVATQTIQQSLDLDADLLITDLCPVDVLLQRLGRVHRHVRSRPSGFEAPRVVVLAPADRGLDDLIEPDGLARGSHGLGTVYRDLRILEATWRLIEKGPDWAVPGDCRSLVECATHSEALDRIVAEGGVAWRAHAQRIRGSRSGDQRLAELNLVDWDVPYWENPFPNDRRVPSRLGERDRRVTFPGRPRGPFGFATAELTLKALWAAAVPADVFEASDVCNLEVGFTFRYGPSGFIYDRYGVRPTGGAAGSPSPREEDDDET
ncbi:MAG: CRISPR-associated helicase Cas3' [Planctomycetes bacterium]|nr:CRISPR-associated helicase Cas3' [Planctomycetota bacterium]